ncbi:hypothetical protein Tco_0581241 [Tanacetum coccineum]
MDLYHSRLTQDDLDDLIIKYKIPRDLHPRLPLEEFVMSELLDDAIGIYHRMFDFFGVRIPFSSFLLALIKHYRVYFSQLGPLGLNKVINFEVLCRSLLIEPTVTLFRVFQTLCKQGDWFSFAKRRAPSPVCVDDNFSCMKHWKSGFFIIDRRAIPDAIVSGGEYEDKDEDFRRSPYKDKDTEDIRRHPKAAIDDPRPAAGSFSMADGADGNGIGGGLELCFVTGAEVQEEPHLDVRPTLQRLLFYYTPPVTVDAVIPNPTMEDLAVGTPSSKILAKTKASQKRKASTSGATSSHVTKRTRSALAQSSSSTTRPSLFVADSDDESDGDDDACVEIPLVTPLRFAVVIPSLGNQGRSSTTSAAEGRITRDSRGKGIMADDAAALDAIHAHFFPFSAGPYYASYPQDGIAGNYEFTREEWDAPYRPTFGVLTKEVFKDHAVYKTMVDQFPTPGEMVRVEALSEVQLTAKMGVLNCMMMSHGGELVARYHGLLQSHHEYVQSTNSRLKGYQEKVAGAAGLELQVSTLKKQVYGLNDKLVSSDASFAKSKAKGKERKKRSIPLPKATALEAEKDEEILRLKKTPPEFASFFRGQFQDLVWKFLASDEFSRVKGELLSLAVSAGFERGLRPTIDEGEVIDELNRKIVETRNNNVMKEKIDEFLVLTDFAVVENMDNYHDEVCLPRSQYGVSSNTDTAYRLHV